MSNPQIFKPSNRQTLKPSNPQTLKPSNPQTLKPPFTHNYARTLGKSKSQALKPSNSQTCKPSPSNRLLLIIMRARLASQTCKPSNPHFTFKPPFTHNYALTLGKAKSQALISQRLSWRLSLDFLGYCCPEFPRSQSLSWRFFRRRHSPGDPSWISLDTVVQSVLGRKHFPGASPVADTLLETLPGFAWLLLSRVSSVANTLQEVVPSLLDHRTMVS